MLSNEKIAHDLAIVYLSNRYGIDISGGFSLTNGDGSGDIETEHLPTTDEIKYKKISTGEEGFLGIEKKTKVEDGFAVDSAFSNIFKDYKRAYAFFLSKIENE